MNPGAMDRRIRIDEATETQDPGSGATEQTWLPRLTCWAEKRNLPGAEFYQAQQMAATADVVWRIRWPSAISPTPDESWRLVELADDRIYDLVAVQEIGRRDGLEIRARARADA